MPSRYGARPGWQVSGWYSRKRATLPHAVFSMGSTRRSESSTLAGASAEGLFRAGDGTLVNADVNGSYNIIQKAFPKAFEGIEGVPVVHPVRVEPSQTDKTIYFLKLLYRVFFTTKNLKGPKLCKDSSWCFGSLWCKWNAI
jgi:hypothetical protein